MLENKINDILKIYTTDELDDLLEEIYTLVSNSMITIKASVTFEMSDIIKYLSETESLIKQYGTLVNAPSILDIQKIISSQFDREDYPFI